MVYYVLDCDTGRDDALAMVLFQRLNFSLKAIISTSGNVNLENVIENNLRFSSLIGSNIPVFKGVSGPIKELPNYDTVVGRRHRTLGNGLSDVVLPDTTRELCKRKIVDWIKDFVKSYGKIHYVITGPASTAAHVLKDLERPEEYISHITMMGGKFSPLWEILDNGADFNIAADPYAVEVLLKSKINIQFVPMNATFPIFIDHNDLSNIKPKDNIGKICHQIMLKHLENFSPEDVFRFHDPMVPMALNSIAFFKEFTVDINMDETHDDFGRLLSVNDGYNVKLYTPPYSDTETLKKYFLEKIINILFS